MTAAALPAMKPAAKLLMRSLATESDGCALPGSELPEA